MDIEAEERNLKPIGWVGEEGYVWYFDGPGDGIWHAHLHGMGDLIHWKYEHRDAWVTQYLALEIWEDFPDVVDTILSDAADYLNRCVDRGWFTLEKGERP